MSQSNVSLQCYAMRLPLIDPFTISRGTIDHQDSLVVHLQGSQFDGWGEVTANDFYGHSIESMREKLASLASEDLQRIECETPEQCWAYFKDKLQGDMFALSALDMAIHDYYSKAEEKPTWQVWDLQWNDALRSSFTIGIDTTETMVRKLKAQPDWGIYKIKLGTDRDLEIIESLRQHTDAIFRVDANCAWTASQAIEMSKQLKPLGVQFIEQPLTRDSSAEDKRKVCEESVLPIIADEDCQTEEDVSHCLELFDGINVKLCKCGGLTPALRMLKQAKAAGKKTMIGCMVESKIGISGAAQLAPVLDYADLDGANLIADSPTNGVSICNGKIPKPTLPGIGASLQTQRLAKFAL